MKLTVLTKPFGALPAPALAECLAAAGAEGADLLVRAGQTANAHEPSGITATIGALAAAGVSTDLVTTDLTAADGQADRVLGACAQAGATLVRAGFYRYDPRTGHRLGVDEARRGLDSLADLAERHSIRLVLQWHHGTLHSSTAHALHLLDGRDSILAYPDPGNQAKEGSESWPLALDMIGVDRVACVGVKNAVWTAPPSATDGGWTCDWRPFADGGVVDWPATLRVLRDRGYRGLLSLHVHYPTGDPLGAVTRDVRHLRELLEGASEM